MEDNVEKQDSGDSKAEPKRTRLSLVEFSCLLEAGLQCEMLLKQNKKIYIHIKCVYVYIQYMHVYI